MSELQRWEERFAAPDYWFGKAPNAFLKSHAHLLKPGRKALAIADGEGRNGVFLAECGLDVLSLDFSPNAVAKAKALAAERGVTLRAEVADLFRWHWPPAAFDVVVGIFFQFAPPAQRTQIFAGIKKTLKDGGLLLIQGYRPEQLKYGTGGPPHAENLYTRALLEEAFGDFSSLEISEHDSVIAEGVGHNGMSALIDLVGRK
ncbi:MAG TPA: class I SAM-dependent methyltransferase [Xanthobacteraceae bacterium]|nr:class I SAM-dependent methyltransferase [Xanthobacteraceae bacterium]